MKLRARRGNDEGAVMIIALLIITVVAVVTTALLTRGDGSLRATIALRQVAETSYSADGAAQVALNDLRTGYWDGNATKPSGWAYTNVAGDGCFGKKAENSIVSPDTNLSLPNFYPSSVTTTGTSAYVECVPENATGAQGTDRLVTSANSPGDAIITTGTSSNEDGLRSDNKPLTVRGGVRVRTNVVSAKGNPKSVQVNDADLKAASCNNVGNIGVVAPFTANCSAAYSGYPSYGADITTIPDLAPAPTCGSSYLAFSPGYYDDLNDIATWTSSCNKGYWFKPGTYYFDFHNSDSNDPLFNAAVRGSLPNGDQWTISGRKVIGGTAVDSNGNALAAGTPPPANAVAGKACQSPINSTGAAGVQFILGGDSRILFGSDAQVELCASYRRTVPPIVLYQWMTDGNPTVTKLIRSNGAALTPTGTVTVTKGTGNTDPSTFAPTPLPASTVRDEGNGVAQWDRTTVGQATETRTLTINGFSPSAQIQKGAVLTAARLLVRHKEASTGVAAPTVTITPAGGSALTKMMLGLSSTPNSETIDLKSTRDKTSTTLNAGVFNALAKQVHDNGYTGASLDYTATSDKGTVAVPKTSQLDSVQLELEFYVPQLRGPSAITNNCVTAINDCYIMDTDKRSEVYLQGTTYLPGGRVELQVANTVGQVFRWGVILRSLYANLNGAAPPGALIELPDNSPGFGLNGTVVQLTVYVCPGKASCDASGRLALKVRAQIWDKDGDASTLADRQVTILNWSHQN